MNSPDVLFLLVRAALGKENVQRPDLAEDLADVDWRDVIDLSVKQCVDAIAIDGLQTIYDHNPRIRLGIEDPGFEEDRMTWFANLWDSEVDYKVKLAALEKLVDFYGRHDIPVMLLKGYGLSMNYPVPSHRYSGDIDIYLGAKWEEADRLIAEELGINVDNSHHHHSVFDFEGQTVENHFDFVNVYSHASNKGLEKLFKRLASDSTKAVEGRLPSGQKILYPSADLNALFLIRHCAIHFAAEFMFIRQMLDWVLFVDNHHEEIDWTLFWTEVRKLNMHKFVLCVTTIAVRDLGIERGRFHIPEEYASFEETDARLVERVKADILHPEFNEKASGSLKYVLSRFRIWWHNRWKHKIVYSDGLLSTFFSQIRSHLMKPSTLHSS